MKYDYEVVRETNNPYDIFPENINKIQLLFVKHNQKVFRILLVLPDISSVYFAPIWQRNIAGNMVFEFRWKDNNVLTFSLKRIGNDLCGTVGNGLHTKLICLSRTNVCLPNTNKTLVLTNLWRYIQLTHYANYEQCNDHSPNDGPPHFEYSAKSNHLSVMLCNTYNLNEYVDSENDFNTMRDIMKWTNGILAHDGTQAFIARREANSILSTHSGKASCRGLAIVLCEALLSVGIKSRFVICCPAEDPYDECHAVCIAFSNYYKKWIMLDPTNNLYIKDEFGNYLDLFEFRNCLTKNIFFELNEDTSWNGAYVSKNQYCDYMVKNLIRFKCTLKYYPGCDHLGQNTIVLLPKNYSIKSNDKSICIRNPQKFWERN